MTDTEPDTSDGQTESDDKTDSSLPVQRRTYLTALAAGAVAAGETAAQPDQAGQTDVETQNGDRPFSYGWGNGNLGYGHGPYGGSELPPIATNLPPRNIDPQKDNLYRDIRGESWRPGVSDADGLDILDVQALFNNLDNPDLQDNSALFNFAGVNPNEVSVLDVQALFNDIGNQ
jgi:hypothetical protein